MADTTHEPAANAADAAYGAEASVGLPQLDFSTFPHQIFWLVIALGAIYYMLSRTALPRIAGVLAERQGVITNDLVMAEEFKRKAADAEAAYEQALADARAESNRIIGETRDAIQAELDAALAEADAKIAERTAEGEKRIAEINAQAAEAARDAARDAAGEIIGLFGADADRGRIDAALDAAKRS